MSSLLAYIGAVLTIQIISSLFKRAGQVTHPTLRCQPVTMQDAKLPFQPKMLDKTITVIGRASVGKSSLCNVLLGKEAFKVAVGHGTTQDLQKMHLFDEWYLQDTPGLLDSQNYHNLVMRAATKSLIIVYVTSGQLYRQEIDFLHDLSGQYSAKQHFIILLNKNDLRSFGMSRQDRKTELEALTNQVSFLPSCHIVNGTAMSHDGRTNLHELQKILASLIVSSQ